MGEVLFTGDRSAMHLMSFLLNPDGFSLSIAETILLEGILKRIKESEDFKKYLKAKDSKLAIQQLAFIDLWLKRLERIIFEFSKSGRWQAFEQACENEGK